MFRRGERWDAISSAEFLRRVAGLSSAFVELGVKTGDRVAIFSANRPEWHTADFAITGAGGVSVPIYFNESPQRMVYILNHSEARIIFVSGARQLEKLLACRSELLTVEHTVAADAGPEAPPECLRYETLVAGAGATEIASYRLRTSQVQPSQLSSLIYTSGTTGEPKGVMLTHTNFCSNVTDTHLQIRFDTTTDLALSFLPLAHVYGRMIDYSFLFHGITVAYVEAVEQVAQAMLELRPTTMAAVPRVFEKIYTRIVEQGSKATGTKRELFDWSMRVASQSAKWRTGEGQAPLSVRLPALKKSDGVLLDGWHTDISGLRIDGDFSGADVELSAQPCRQLRESHRECRAKNRRRRRDPGARALRDAGVLQEPRGDPGSS